MPESTHTNSSAIATLPGAQETELAQIERRLAEWEARRQLVLKVLTPSDLSRFGNKIAKNKYASEKLLRIFGGKLELLKDQAGHPIIERTMIDDDPDMGRLVIFTTFARYTSDNGIVFEAAGSFSSKDPFYARDDNAWKPFAEVNLADVLTAAFTESRKKAIFGGCGLGDFEDDEYTQMLSGKVQGHDFKGSKKQTQEPTIGWGDDKGKKASELSRKQVMFYLPKYEKSAADPAKERWKPANLAMIEALKARLAELGDETATAAQEAAAMATAGSAPAEDKPAAEDKPEPAREMPDRQPTTRGTLIGTAFKILEAHGGKTGKAQATLLKTLTSATFGTEKGTLTDLTDDELRAIGELTEDQIASIRANAG